MHFILFFPHYWVPTPFFFFSSKLYFKQLDQGNNRNAVISPVTAHFFNGGVQKPTDAESVVVSDDRATIAVKFAGDFGRVVTPTPGGGQIGYMDHTSINLLCLFNHTSH
jgi:hypothetical protein